MVKKLIVTPPSDLISTPFKYVTGARGRVPGTGVPAPACGLLPALGGTDRLPLQDGREVQRVGGRVYPDVAGLLPVRVDH